MISGIFWDNDGVLVDTEALYFRATAEVLRQAGFELTRAAFIEVSLQRGTSAFALAEGKLSRQEVEGLRRKRDDRYAELLRGDTKAMDGVEETLAALHGRVRMAIVTSSRREHFDIIHRQTGLLRYFDFVLTREDYSCAKPHPEPYLTALARSGLRPEQCLAVEDSERGLLSARGAGLRCLVLPGELTRNSDFAGADRILSDIREVPAALLGS